MSLGSIIWWLQYKLWSQAACVPILALTVISCVVSGAFLSLIACQFLSTALNAQRCAEDFNDYSTWHVVMNKCKLLPPFWEFFSKGTRNQPCIATASWGLKLCQEWSISDLILLTGKLRLRKVQWLSQGYTTNVSSPAVIQTQIGLDPKAMLFN